jgi:hypothetical protein
LQRNQNHLTDGDYVNECKMKAAELYCPEKSQIFKAINLSANTLAERVNDSAEDESVRLKKSVRILWHVQLLKIVQML